MEAKEVQGMEHSLNLIKEVGKQKNYIICVRTSATKNDLTLQALVQAYYEDYSYDDLVTHLMDAKEVGDEFTLLLASKWLRRNITVITSKKDWSVYSNCSPDIVITYKGKDRYMRGKWASSQLVSRGSQPRSKSSHE